MIAESALIEAVRIVAATEPDRIYNIETACTYRPNRRNSCGCIVGEALTYLDVEAGLLDILDTWAGQAISVFWGAGAVADLLKDLFTLDALTSPWVKAVQTRQDQGIAWGEAVKQADAQGREQGWVLT